MYGRCLKYLSKPTIDPKGIMHRRVLGTRETLKFVSYHISSVAFSSQGWHLKFRTHCPQNLMFPSLEFSSIKIYRHFFCTSSLNTVKKPAKNKEIFSFYPRKVNALCTYVLVEAIPNLHFLLCV